MSVGKLRGMVLVGEGERKGRGGGGGERREKSVYMRAVWRRDRLGAGQPALTPGAPRGQSV